MVFEQTEKAVASNPVVIEHIGELQDFEFEFLATGEINDDSFVYDVSGSKGSGRVQVITEGSDDVNEENIVSGKLIMSSGEEYDLIPSANIEPSEVLSESPEAVASPAAVASPKPEPAQTP